MTEGNECLPEGVGVGSCGTGVLRRTDKHTFGVRVLFVALTPVMLLVGVWLCQNKRELFVACQVHPDRTGETAERANAKRVSGLNRRFIRKTAVNSQSGP